MNIAMITCHDENYSNLADLTVPNRREYCQRWGYEFVCKTEGFAYPNTYTGNREDLLIGFEKIHMFLENFERRTDLDWIFWTGADVIMTNFNFRIENIIDDSYHMIVCFDGNGMNTDSMLVKNSRVGRGLMRWVLDNVEDYRKADWYEQRALIDFYFRHPIGKDVIKALPQRVMNSYDYNLYPEWRNRPHIDHTGHDGDWQPGDFVFQVPGLPVDQRIRVIEHYLQRVIK